MTLPLKKSDSSGRTDARKIRSRDALHAAFLQLLEHKALEDISIREIAAAAQVGHATFYRHYQGKTELLNDLAAAQIREVVDLSLPVLEAVDNRAACFALCRYIDEHRTLWTTLLTGGASAAVKEELLRISRELTADTEYEHSDELPKELRLILVVGSITETLSWWLREEKPPPAERVAGYLDHIISNP